MQFERTQTLYVKLFKMAKIVTTLFGTLALIPQVAEIPVNETLQFLSDPMESYNGTEQNLQLRAKPRQSFQYQIPVKPSTDPSIWNTSYGAIRKKWAVPVWHDAQNVGTVAAGADHVLCDTTYYDLRPSSLAMLFNLCGTYQILEIDDIESDRINISGTTDAISNAYLIPVRIGYVTGSITKPTNGFTGKVSINFFVLDTAEYTPSAPTQYLSNDIYFSPGLTDAGGVETSFNMREDVIDYDLGEREVRTPWALPKFGRPHRVLMATKEERKEYRDFIYRRLGKVRPFWLPTFENNLRIKNTGTVVSTLVTAIDSFTDYATARTHIAIEATSGWYARSISAPTPTGPDTMQFTLSSALNIPASSIIRVSYLGLNRLNTDQIEFNYGSKTSESAVSILEISP